MSFGNFAYPSKGPLKPSDIYISWSSKAGNLISLVNDATTASLTPNSIYNVSNVILRRYVKDNRVAWLFSTSSEFPANGVVSVKLDDTTGTWAFTVNTGGFSSCILYKQTGSFSEPACTVTIDMVNVRILFTFSAVSAFPAGDYKLVQYGIDSPMTSVVATYKMTIKTLTSALAIIDSSSSTLFTLTFSNLSSLNTVVSVDLHTYTHYLIPSSVGDINIAFTIN